MIKTYLFVIILAVIVGLAWRAKFGIVNQSNKITITPKPTIVVASPSPTASPSAVPSRSLTKTASNSAKKAIYLQPTVIPTK